MLTEAQDGLLCRAEREICSTEVKYAQSDLLSRHGVVDSFLRSSPGSCHEGTQGFGWLGDTNSPAKHHGFAFGRGLDRVCSVECQTQGTLVVLRDELLETMKF
jgi:hypothetical protein